MGGITSLSVANSGLRAASAGLYVIGHNMANVDTQGYVRQRVLQKEFFSSNIGVNANGKMQVGLGTDISSINQIRNKFLDTTYRREVSKLNYYSVKADAGMEIETIIGELQSDYRAQSVIQDMRDALTELSIKPSGLETRDSFLSTCLSFITKMDNVYKRLFEYQHNLDDQVRQCVTDINNLVQKVDTLNGKISANEVSGDSANDYRDQRNVALDELSKLINITYSEDIWGNVNIIAEGNELLVNGAINKIGLRYIDPNYSFVEPVFTLSTKILSSDDSNYILKPVIRFDKEISPENNNDYGKLKGLLMARGNMPANYASITVMPNPGDYANGVNDGQYIADYAEYYNATQFTIPKMMNQLDTLAHSIIKMINDAVAPTDKNDPNAPKDLDGNSTFLEVFTRKYVDRYDADGNYIEEDKNNLHTLYSIGNIIINPEFQDRNLSKLSLSLSGDYDDARLVLDNMLSWWTTPNISIAGSEKLSIDDAYRRIIVGLGTETSESISFVDAQMVLVNQAEEKISAISGVSLDEEMKNMMIYQHAYNASARIFNVIDSMLDKLINGTGRL